MKVSLNTSLCRGDCLHFNLTASTSSNVTVFWLYYDLSTILFSCVSAPHIHKVKASLANFGKIELAAIKFEEKVFTKKPQTGILPWLAFHFTATEQVVCLLHTYRNYYSSLQRAPCIINGYVSHMHAHKIFSYLMVIILKTTTSTSSSNDVSSYNRAPSNLLLSSHNTFRSLVLKICNETFLGFIDIYLSL
jgi:hypothetical protein